MRLKKRLGTVCREKVHVRVVIIICTSAAGSVVVGSEHRVAIHMVALNCRTVRGHSTVFGRERERRSGRQLATTRSGKRVVSYPSGTYTHTHRV